MHSNALLLFLVAMFPQQEKKTFLEEIGTYGNSKTSFRPINKDWEWGAFFSPISPTVPLKISWIIS